MGYRVQVNGLVAALMFMMSTGGSHSLRVIASCIGLDGVHAYGSDLEGCRPADG